MRQVDVKALVSHVIRGDGVNKCRICMGDTSEGQVHLSDTVVIEGDKPVTLSELLEIVTGIQVPLERDLPAGMCVECATCAINAANFRSKCRETSSKWDMTLQLLYNLPSQCSEQDKIIFAVLDVNQMTFIIDENDLNPDTPLERLQAHLSTQRDLNSTTDSKKVETEECDLKKTVVNEQITNRGGSDIEEVDKNEILVKKRIKREETKLKDVKRKRFKLDESESKDVLKNERLVTKTVKSRENDQMPQCPNCNKKFGHPVKLYHHLRGSTDTIRACYVCGEIMTRDELVSHLGEAHNVHVYDCKKCPALLLTNEKYIQHLSKAHSRGACTCGECGWTFQSNQAYYAHTSVHRRKICPGCDKIFENQTCYLYHKKSCRHVNRNRDCKTVTKMTVEVKNRNRIKNIRDDTRGSTGEVYICDYCGKTFARKKYLTAHMQIVHMKNTHIPCKYCGKLLATAHMTEHLKNHELDLSFNCEHCGIVLKSKLGFIQHLRLHTGERPYPCKICKESFSAASRRSEHMRKIHSKADIVLKHACKLCPAKFGRPYRLKKHMKSSHINESDETLQFECNECHEKFGSCRGLLHHSRKHQKVDFPHKRPEKNIMLQVFSNCVDEK